MRRVLTTWMLAFLLLAPVACGAGEPEAEVPDTTAEESEAGAPDASDAEESEMEAEGAESGEEAAADGAEGEAAAESDTGPTLTPEEVALIQGFQPPSKGSDDALVTIYEFSDYI